MNKNIVGWFEIAVNDMERAMKFYQEVLGVELSRNKMGPLDMAWFPMNFGNEGATGSLCYHPDFYKPSAEGTLIYFSCPSGDLSNELAKIEPAGGKVLVPKTPISDEFGFMAVFMDSEGNRVALHSQK